MVDDCPNEDDGLPSDRVRKSITMPEFPDGLDPLTLSSDELVMSMMKSVPDSTGDEVEARKSARWKRRSTKLSTCDRLTIANLRSLESSSGSEGGSECVSPEGSPRRRQRNAEESRQSSKSTQKLAEDVGARLAAHRVHHGMDYGDFKLFKTALKSSSCFCLTVSDSEVFELSQLSGIFDFKQSEEVHSAGQAATHFFLVREGEFLVSFDGSEPRVLKRGDCFGEVAMIHGSICWETAKCLTGGSLFGLRRDDMRRVFCQVARRSFDESMKTLERVRIFQLLDNDQKKQLCATAVTSVYGANMSVVKQEDQGMGGDCLYVVKSGTLDVKVSGRLVRSLGTGDYFGERSLLYDEPRSATVTVSSLSCTLLRFNRSLLQTVLGDHFYPALFHNVIVIGLKGTLSFSQYGTETLKQLASFTMVQDFPAHSMPFQHDHARGLRFLIVLDGQVVVTGPGHENGLLLQRGDHFGDEYVTNFSMPFQHRVENSADYPCKLAILSTDALQSLLSSSENAEEALDEKQKMAMLRRVYIFRHLSEHHCNLIAKSFHTLRRQKGEPVITEGEIGSQFFVIKSGELLVTKQGRSIRTLGKSDYFGERGLLYDEPRTATVLCASAESELLVIDKTVFLSICEEQMIKHLTHRIELQNQDVALSDLELVRVLGCGTYGIVKLVENPKTRKQYALKCISRKKAIQNQQQDALERERMILLENDHPFIVKVVKTFKDLRYLYFLTEVIIGGELFDAIRKLGLCTKAQAHFYSGSLALALESLHERNIAYRDLKPENVLLDSQGYIKLIDFGCATKLKGITFTLVGTPHYLAPEVILGKGYGVSCDIWSLGVCAYELLAGPQPFAADSENHFEVFREILVAPLKFPAHLKEHKDCINFLRLLLRRPIDTRLGCGTTGWNAVRMHNFFEGFSWDRLLSRGLEPPLIPQERQPLSATSALHEEADEVSIDPNGWDKDF